MTDRPASTVFAEAAEVAGYLVVANTYWEEPWGFGHRPAADPVVTAQKPGRADDCRRA